MSESWSKVLKSFLAQMEEHGYTGFPKVARGIGAIYGLVNR